MLRRIQRRFRQILHLSPTTCFSDLPNELVLLVAGYLAVPDINSLLQTNRLFVSLLMPLIVKRAARSLLPKRYGQESQNTLHWAVSHNRTWLLRELLAQGAHVFINHHSIGETTPLQSAVMLGHEEPVRILLENGADPELENRAGWTALMTAVIANKPRICALLLEQGAQIDAQGRNVGSMEAIHYAVGLGRLSILELLLERGCGVGGRTRYGGNLTVIAVVCGQEAIVKLLVRRGLRANKRLSEQEKDLLLYAIRRVSYSLECMLSDAVHDPLD